LKRRSDVIGIKNFSGSPATRSARSSFGKPKPMMISSAEMPAYTMLFTRNRTRSLIRCSVVRGRVSAIARTSSTVTTPAP
jgi:hypothetical protein